MDKLIIGPANKKGTFLGSAKSNNIIEHILKG